MPLNARLKKLERALADRPAVASANAGINRFGDLVMSDPVAHDLFTRIVDLTPDAMGNPSFDFVKAARERPGLAEAAIALSNLLPGRRV
jgi:hypothetical protein